MTITSTEFQQNVGHYLTLVENGEEVNINRLKPIKSTFALKKINKNVRTRKTKNQIELMLEYIKKHQIHSTTGESGLELQRRVRS